MCIPERSGMFCSFPILLITMIFLDSIRNVNRKYICALTCFIF
jgi:hypothetical protein